MANAYKYRPQYTQNTIGPDPSGPGAAQRRRGMGEDMNVGLAVKSMELARRSAVLCKAIALYQERSPEVNRLPSTLLRLVRDVQSVLAGDETCNRENARSAAGKQELSRGLGRRSGSSAINRKKATRTKNVSDAYREIIDLYFEGRNDEALEVIAAVRGERAS